MAKQIPMIAEQRDKIGKGFNRRLRSAGMIPAVIYGKGVDPVSVAVNPKELQTAMSSELGLNSLLEMDIQKEQKSLEKRVTLLKDYQTHPLRGDYIHADFVAIDVNKPINIRVPFELTGRAKGVVDGGLIQIIRRDIGIACLPKDIPATIELDVSPLDIGDSLHVRDVPLPKGAEALDSGAYTILTCAAPIVEKVTEEVEEGEGEATAEGAAVAAPAEGDKPAEEKKA